jgi:hypothetical protein
MNWLRRIIRSRQRRQFALALMCADMETEGQVMKHAALAARAVRNADALLHALTLESP